MTRDDDAQAGLEQIRGAVTALVDDVFASLEAIATATKTLWDRIENDSLPTRSGDLAVLRDVIISELQRQRQTFNGTGVVIAEGVLSDSARYLEWWRPDTKAGGPAQRLNLDLNPHSEYFYDYTGMEWFTVPRDRGLRWVYGPYLDYTGVDLYVCTFAVPITSARGTFLGVAGADVPIARLDAALLPTLTAGHAAVALANAAGRVIVANHADHVTGSKISRDVLAAAEPVPHVPWSLVPLNNT